MNFIENQILNITGLAREAWSDKPCNSLKRRLTYKAEHNTFTEAEKRLILRLLYRLYTQARIDFNM